MRGAPAGAFGLESCLFCSELAVVIGFSGWESVGEGTDTRSA